MYVLKGAQTHTGTFIPECLVPEGEVMEHGASSGAM
jgi:hypothetical protein